MRGCRNLVLDLLENLKEYKINLIPREQNVIIDVLATSSSVFKIPIHLNRKYEIEVKNKPTIPNNVKYWKVFEDNKQMKRFLEMNGEFENIHIDEENVFGRYNESLETSGLDPNSKYYLNIIGDKEILKLKNNCIPNDSCLLKNYFIAMMWLRILN